MADDSTISNPNDLPGAGLSVEDPECACAATQGDKSVYLHIGWTFSSGTPEGEYTLELNGQTYQGQIDKGDIHIKDQLVGMSGSGTLTIKTKDGPVFQSEVELGLGEIQSLEGIGKRLTNLGYYAGTDGTADGRFLWAVRAFKRAKMNSYRRNATAREDHTISEAFLTALQAESGIHPDDVIAGLSANESTRATTYCGMFGSRDLGRHRFADAGRSNDVDPSGTGAGGIWARESAKDVEEPIAGTYKLHLRAYDGAEGEAAVKNKINLPQPIHMTHFVLFELGYWMVHGERDNWEVESGTRTRRVSEPRGDFERYLQWSVREFQCHAKMEKAAKEDVASAEIRYLPRLFAQSPVDLVEADRYPDDSPISGVMNEETRTKMQQWADKILRCPVIAYASTDNRSNVANGSDMARLLRENLWLHNDHADSSPRMYAIDYSDYYEIPEDLNGDVSVGGFTFPRPIVLGDYQSAFDGGQRAVPPRHTWPSAQVEVRPDVMLGRGGNTGAGLTPAELSTFKAVRTAAHFECYAYLDCINAYDDVTISFGPCHWTLARCTGGDAAEPREMPAFLAYVRSHYGAEYTRCFAKFGLTPEGTWPLTMSGQTGTYNSRIMIDIEGGGRQRLCGAGSELVDNKYAKNWHSYYRFQMACRTSSDFKRAMWDFARIRVRDILDKTFTVTVSGRQTAVRLGDAVTSEKGVAMLLRWHIYRPAHLFRTNDNRLRPGVQAAYSAHPTDAAQREARLLREIRDRGQPRGGNQPHMEQIHGWTNVPQAGTAAHYELALVPPTLSSTAGSFTFAPPPA